MQWRIDWQRKLQVAIDVDSSVDLLLCIHIWQRRHLTSQNGILCLRMSTGELSPTTPQKTMAAKITYAKLSSALNFQNLGPSLVVFFNPLQILSRWSFFLSCLTIPGCFSSSLPWPTAGQQYLIHMPVYREKKLKFILHLWLAVERGRSWDWRIISV
jgi:hypothetical protein